MNSKKCRSILSTEAADAQFTVGTMALREYKKMRGWRYYNGKRAEHGMARKLQACMQSGNTAGTAPWPVILIARKPARLRE